MTSKKLQALSFVTPPPDLEHALEEHTRTLRETLEAIRDRTPVDGIRSKTNCDSIVDSIERLLNDEECDCECHQQLSNLVKKYRRP